MEGGLLYLHETKASLTQQAGRVSPNRAEVPPLSGVVVGSLRPPLVSKNRARGPVSSTPGPRFEIYFNWLFSSIPLHAWSLGFSPIPSFGSQDSRAQVQGETEGPLSTTKGFPASWLAPRAQPQAQPSVRTRCLYWEKPVPALPPGAAGSSRRASAFGSLRWGWQRRRQRGMVEQRVPHLHLSGLRRQALGKPRRRDRQQGGQVGAGTPPGEKSPRSC